MLRSPIRRKRPAQTPDWPHLDILFTDEEEADGSISYDETNTYFQTPVIPREGETITLDGDFRRRGTFTVERVEYTFCCDGRHRGWVRDLGVYVRVFVRQR